LEREKIESIIESLLYVAGEPLSLKRLCSLLGRVKHADVRAALDEVKQRWGGPGRGLRLVEVSGGFQLQTDPDNAAWVGKLVQSRPIRLSRPALECLAIIAYKQPVTRAEIEQVRGVDSGGVLKTLLEHGFLKIAGRKDVPGKPLIYATDKRFMEFFRLKSLSELPTLKDLPELTDELPFEAAIGEEGAEVPDQEVEAGPEDEADVDGGEPEEVEETDRENEDDENNGA